MPPGVVVLQVEHIGTLSEVDFAREVMTTRRAVVVPVFERGDRDRPFVHAAERVGRITEHLFAARLVHVLTDPATFCARIGEIAASAECSRLPEPVTVTHENKRSVLQAILDAWLRSAGGGEMTPLVIPHPSFAALACESERCIACGACANQCKVRALRFIRDKNLLVYTPAACLNCGVCEAICPEHALTLEEGLRLERSFFTERKLARVEALRCAECGRPFSTAKRVRLVSEKLRMVKGDDPVLRDLLTLCPECRTKKAVLTMIHKKPERR